MGEQTTELDKKTKVAEGEPAVPSASNAVCVERAGVSLTWTFAFAPTGRDREDGARKGGEIGGWHDKDGRTMW